MTVADPITIRAVRFIAGIFLALLLLVALHGCGPLRFNAEAGRDLTTSLAEWRLAADIRTLASSGCSRSKAEEALMRQEKLDAVAAARRVGMAINFASRECPKVEE